MTGMWQMAVMVLVQCAVAYRGEERENAKMSMKLELLANAVRQLSPLEQPPAQEVSDSESKTFQKTESQEHKHEVDVQKSRKLPKEQKRVGWVQQRELARRADENDVVTAAEEECQQPHFEYWAQAYGNPNGNDFEKWMSSTKQSIEEVKKVNCWEIWIVIGIKSGFWKEGGRNIFTDGCSEFNYMDTIHDFLGMEDALPFDSKKVQKGDMLLFYGDSHVGLSAGGDQVYSLWDPLNSHLEKTSVGTLLNKIEENDETWLESVINFLQVCAKFQDKPAFSEVCDGRHGTWLDTLMDYKSLNSHDPNYAELKNQNPITDKLKVMMVSKPFTKKDLNKLQACAWEY